MANQRTDASGPQAYELSVRALDAAPAKKGAVILVAGRYRPNDSLQKNIYTVTDAAYTMFQNQGYTNAEIRYIALESRPNIDVAPVTVDEVRATITAWARETVGDNQALTLYMMDHGNQGLFYLDDPRGEHHTPAMLDNRATPWTIAAYCFLKSLSIHQFSD